MDARRVNPAACHLKARGLARWTRQTRLNQTSGSLGYCFKSARSNGNAQGQPRVAPSSRTWLGALRAANQIKSGFEQLRVRLETLAPQRARAGPTPQRASNKNTWFGVLDLSNQSKSDLG